MWANCPMNVIDTGTDDEWKGFEKWINEKWFKRLGPEDDLDVDAVRDLDPHQLPEGALVCV